MREDHPKYRLERASVERCFNESLFHGTPHPPWPRKPENQILTCLIRIRSKIYTKIQPIAAICIIPWLPPLTNERFLIKLPFTTSHTQERLCIWHLFHLIFFPSYLKQTKPYLLLIRSSKDSSAEMKDFWNSFNRSFGTLRPKSVW